MRFLIICGAILSLVACGEEGECFELEGTYKETGTITYTTCPDLLPRGEVIESVYVLGGSGGGGGGGGDPTMDCVDNGGTEYDLAACSLDADVTCDHFDDQGFYLWTRRVETHFDLEPSGDFTGTAQFTLSDWQTGVWCSAVVDLDGELL